MSVKPSLDIWSGGVYCGGMTPTSPLDVPPTLALALAVLDEGGEVGVRELARRLSLSSGRGSQVAESLTTNGWARRTPTKALVRCDLGRAVLRAHLAAEQAFSKTMGARR